MQSKRKFIKLSYKGTHFSGWQIQPNAPTIQDEIEKALSKLHNSPIAIVGCGRTDAGVHAQNYLCHTDLPVEKFENKDLVYKLNGILNDDIAIHTILDVEETAHARFDATARSYFYNIHFYKAPFIQDTSFKYNQSKIPDFQKMNTAAALLKKYQSFFPFCKSHTETDTFLCDISESYWEKSEGHLKFHITANRFLRGMVRLIVGMCINVAIDKITMQDVVDALENQTRLQHAWSVPAQGLFLSEIKYPYI